MLNWEMEFKKWCPAFKLLTYFGSAKERKTKRHGWSKPNAFHICITSYTLVLQVSHHVHLHMLWLKIACFGHTPNACMSNACIKHTALVHLRIACFGCTARACTKIAHFERSAPAFTKVACCGDIDMSVFQLGLLASDVM